MVFSIQKILGFHDLFPKEKDLDVRTVLKKYSREMLFPDSVSIPYLIIIIVKRSNIRTTASVGLLIVWLILILL